MTDTRVHLTRFEIEILQECAGERPARPFGAAVSQALEVLKAAQFVSPQWRVTALGLAFLKRFPVPGTPRRINRG